MKKDAFWKVARQIASQAHLKQVDQAGRPAIEQDQAMIALIEKDFFFQWLLTASVQYRSNNPAYIEAHFSKSGISFTEAESPAVDLYTTSGPVDIVRSIVEDKIRQQLTHTLIAATYLHDILQISAYTVADLRAQGIPESVIVIVTILTQSKVVSKRDQLIRIRRNDLATIVKLAELDQQQHDVLAMPTTAETVHRLQENRRAMVILQSKYCLAVSQLVPNE